MADKKPDMGASPKKKKGKLGFILILTLFSLSVPFLMPTWTLLLVGLLPTFIALLVDNNDPNKSSTAAVGAMNFAGLTPFLIDLWVKGQTMENTFSILREPSNWLIILGAAAIGELIVFAVPQAMASLTLARAESRLKTLKQSLEQLKASWGTEVATTKPVDQIGRD